MARRCHCCLFLVTSLSVFFFFLMIRPHPISILFPYTTLFRSKGRSTGRAPADETGIALALAFLGSAGRTEKGDRKSTRLNSSHTVISYAVFCLKKKTKTEEHIHRLTNLSQLSQSLETLCDHTQ